GCAAPDVAVEAVWWAPRLSGDVALADTGGAPHAPVALENDLGLDDSMAAPALGVRVDSGRLRLFGDAFVVRERGRGRLGEAFGGIAAGTPVESDLEALDVRAAATFALVPAESVRLAPGLALEVLDVSTDVRSITPISVVERIDVFAPVPMPFLEAEVRLGDFALGARGGAFGLDLGDADGSWWGAEARLEYRPIERLSLFAGYRALHIDVEGRADGQRFDGDVALEGITLGGRLSF